MKGEALADWFPPALIRELSQTLSTEAGAESAVPSYTHWNPAIRWLMFRRLELIRGMASNALSRVEKRDDRAVLDYGCGIGMMIPALAPVVRSLYLCDEQLAPARATAERFGASNVVCVTPEELGSRLGSACVDVVIAADVLEHVDDLPACASEFSRVLRPGGALLVSGPTENFAYRCGRRIVGFSGDYHVRDVYHVEEGIRRAGFALESTTRLPFAMAPSLFRITRWRCSTSEARRF